MKIGKKHKEYINTSIDAHRNVLVTFFKEFYDTIKALLKKLKERKEKKHGK